MILLISHIFLLGIIFLQKKIQLSFQCVSVILTNTSEYLKLLWVKAELKQVTAHVIQNLSKPDELCPSWPRQGLFMLVYMSSIHLPTLLSPSRYPLATCGFLNLYLIKIKTLLTQPHQPYFKYSRSTCSSWLSVDTSLLIIEFPAFGSGWCNLMVSFNLFLWPLHFLQTET